MLEISITPNFCIIHLKDVLPPTEDRMLGSGRIVQGFILEHPQENLEQAHPYTSMAKSTLEMKFRDRDYIDII